MLHILTPVSFHKLFVPLLTIMYARIGTAALPSTLLVVLDPNLVSVYQISAPPAGKDQEENDEQGEPQAQRHYGGRGVAEPHQEINQRKHNDDYISYHMLPGMRQASDTRIPQEVG